MRKQGGGRSRGRGGGPKIIPRAFTQQRLGFVVDPQGRRVVGLPVVPPPVLPPVVAKPTPVRSDEDEAALQARLSEFLAEGEFSHRSSDWPIPFDSEPTAFFGSRSRALHGR